MRNKSLAVLLAVVTSLTFVGGTTAVEAATKRRVSISVSSSVVTQDQNLTISGKVTPARGSKVIIQKKWPGKKWKNVATVRIGADGTYSYTYTVTNLGPRVYRAYAPKARGAKRAYSKSITVTVQPPPPDSDGDGLIDASDTCPAASGPASNGGCPSPPPPPAKSWTFLHDISTVESGGTANAYFTSANGRWTNGVFTAKTVQSVVDSYSSPGENDYADWSLNRRCESFTARVGLDSTTHSSTLMRVRVLTDGALVWTQDMAISEAVDLSLPVANVDRLRLEVIIINRTYGSGWLSTNFGDAQVYCLN